METNTAIRRAKEKAEDLIRDITKKEHISPAELEAVMKSVCLILKVEGAEGGNGSDYEGDFSERSGASRMSRNSSSRHNEMYNNYDPMHYDEASYRRGRSSITGQYVSRDSSSANSSRRYYDGSGYSGHSIQDRMIARLEDMYDEARTEHERQTVQDWINRLSR